MNDVIYINSKATKLVPGGYPNAEQYVRVEKLKEILKTEKCDNCILNKFCVGKNQIYDYSCEFVKLAVDPIINEISKL